MYLAGRHEWQPITINIRDDATGGVSKLVGQQLQKQMDFAEQASAATGQDYKFQTNIEILDGGNGNSAPVILETWEVYGCFLQAANYNNLAYSANEVVTIQLAIRFDNAVQVADGKTTGVGGSFSRVLGGTSTTGIGSTL
jgi:hypothetical protein